jgi:hypothetical protein
MQSSNANNERGAPRLSRYNDTLAEILTAVRAIPATQAGAVEQDEVSIVEPPPPPRERLTMGLITPGNRRRAASENGGTVGATELDMVTTVDPWIDNNRPYLNKARRVMRVGAGHGRKAMNKASQIARSAADTAAAIYENWFNRSTRRRATRRARKLRRTAVEEKEVLEEKENLWEIGVDEHPDIPADTNPEGVGEQPARAAPKFKRGERAHECAAGLILKFGRMPWNSANEVVVRRFLERDVLVADYSVRKTHRVRLVDRATTLYFAHTAGDIAASLALNNKKNKKRYATAQLTMA